MYDDTADIENDYSRYTFFILLTVFIINILAVSYYFVWRSLIWRPQIMKQNNTKTDWVEYDGGSLSNDYLHDYPVSSDSSDATQSEQEFI